MVVPESPVSGRAVGIESAVPFLMGKLHVQTIEELGQRAFICKVAVVLCDVTVSVAIYESVLDRPALTVVSLLIQVIGIGSITNTVLLEISSGTASDTAHLNEIILICLSVSHGQFGKLCILIREVRAY